MQTRNFPIMDGADGNAYPSNAALFGINPVSGSAVTSKTASYTITAPEIGNAFKNGAAITLTLPAPFAGAALWIFKTHDSTLTVAAAANTTINGAASFANSTSGDTGKAMLGLIGISTTEWITTVKLGTWA